MSRKLIGSTGFAMPQAGILVGIRPPAKITRMPFPLSISFNRIRHSIQLTMEWV